MHRHPTLHTQRHEAGFRRHSLRIMHYVLCIALAALSASAAGENLVVNGDFEAKGYTENYKENCGSSYLIDWTCSQAGICTPQGTYLSTAIKNYDNSAWAFLKKASWFSQDIAVVAGPYRLEYDFCGRPNYIAGCDVTVTFGNIVVTNFTGDAGSNNGTIVAHHAIDFEVAETGTYTLKFAQATTADKSPAFDNITLVRTIPQSLTIASAQQAVGAVTPAYGLVSTNVGATFVCSAPEAATNGVVRWRRTGWKYYENGALVNEAPTASTNLVVQGGVHAVLEWQWEPEAGAVLFVRKDGTGHFERLGDAMAAQGSAPSEILLGPGAHAISETVVLHDGMILRSETGDPATTSVHVSRTGLTNAVVVAGEGALLAGVTVSNGFATTSTRAGNLTLTAGCVSNCWITEGRATYDRTFGNNRIGGYGMAGCGVGGGLLTHSRIVKNYGGGIYINGGLVSDCLVSNNDCGAWYTGCGIAMESGTVSRCTIVKNTLGSYSGAGVGLNGNGAVLEHCLVAGNSAGTSGNAGGVWLKFGTVRNCTIVANTANTGGGVHFEGSGSGGTRVFVNNIVYGNTVIADTSAGAPEWTKSYTTAFKMTNNFFAVSTVPSDNRTVGEATLTGNPFFADFAGGDYHLTPSSPCLDAGWGEASIDKDLDGNARVSGPAMDIGCYEYDQSVLSASFDYVLGDATATFTVTGIGFDPADADCYWSFDGAEPTPARHAGTGAQYVLGVSPGEYTVGCAVYLDGEKVYGEVKSALFRVYPARLYVRTDNAAPAAPYDTWARAATNILDAIEWARRENAVVTVSNGTYATSGTVVLDTPVTLQSLNGPEVTILDGGLHHRVVQINSTRAVVAGFAIQNGKGGTDNGDGGGGAYLAGGILTNCIVRGCTGAARVTGAGVVAGGGLVTGCVITNNSVAAWAAAGIFVKNGARLENSLVADNRCTLGVGGIRIGDGHVKSCTIAGNTGSGPGFHRNSTANYGSVVNTVIYGNTDTSGGANPDFNDFPTRSTNVWSSAAFGVVAGGGEPLVGDPKFRNPTAGDYRLKVSSPCRNKAWGALSGTSVDLLGAPRIHGKAMDIGCYEVQQGASTLLLVQ